MAKSENGMGRVSMIWRAMPGIPCLMHRGGLANPMDKYSKQLKELNKRYKGNKCDEYFEQMARVEWFGSLYLNDKAEIVWPRENIKSCIVGGAKLMKKGKDVKAALFIDRDAVIDGPGVSKNLEKMFDDHRFVSTKGVKVGQARVMRTRPQFYDWSIRVDVSFIPGERIDERDIIAYSEQAGRLVALSDFRPDYGKFTVEVVND